MKHFYEHQDDNMRSKLTEHEFGSLPGAWEDMEKRLDQFSSNSGAGTASWSAWFVIGAMLVATTVGILFYQWQSPFGKATDPVLADNNNLQESPVNENHTSIQPTKEKVVANTETSNTISNTTTASTKNTENQLNQNVVAEPGVRKYQPQPQHPNAKLTQTITPQTNEEGSQKEATEVPGIAPTPELDPDGQRPENNNGFPVYTRRTEVIHTFSESTLKWKNTPIPTLGAQITNKRHSSLIDTPLIILQTPFDMPQAEVQFGVNAGVSTQLYGHADKFSVSPVLGVFVRKSFDEHYAVQAGLNYKLVLPQSIKQPFSNNKQADEMAMTVDVDPSAEVNYQTRNATVYGIRSMHIFELPVSFIYEFNRRHSVSMGMKMSYLQGVQTANSLINDMSKAQLGFSSLDLGALAGYEFAINKHFVLGIFYNVGFLNLAKGTQQSTAVYSEQFSGTYILDEAQQQESLNNDERMLPVQVDGENPIFFQAPKNFYNSDLKVLLRYIF